MSKIVRLTESDLNKIVRRVINEETNATCTDGTQGTLKFQNNKWGIMTSDGGFCIVPTQNSQIKFPAPNRPQPTAPTRQTPPTTNTGRKPRLNAADPETDF
jgi:hypothetical protein